MGEGSKAKAKGSTGAKKQIKIEPQLVVPEIHPAEISESSLGMTTFSGFTNNFIGSFSDTEKKVASTVFGTFSVEDNRRKTFYVQFTETDASSATIFVFTGVKNTNTSTVDYQKIGKPTATVPDDATVDAIKARLKLRNIAVVGSWDDEERRAALAGLNDLSDKELDKMKDLKVTRSGSAPSGSSDASSIGAHYVQDSHTIEVFDSAYELSVKEELSVSGSARPNGTLMALGTAPGTVLPGAAHAVMHEAAHVLAYGEIRAAQVEEEDAFKALQKENQNMKAKWSAAPVFYTDKSKDIEATGHKFSYKTKGSPTTEPDKTDFEEDLKALDDAIAKWGAATKTWQALTQSEVMEKFETTASAEMPVTPYSLNEKTGATDDDAKKAALEEFFAEGFAVFHWDPDWLNTHRKPVHDFFIAENHL